VQRASITEVTGKRRTGQQVMSRLLTTGQPAKCLRMGELLKRANLEFRKVA
jgi:predicted transcriptional regulator